MKERNLRRGLNVQARKVEFDSRRRFLLALPGAAVVLAGGGLIVSSGKTHVDVPSGEGASEYSYSGEQLQGGEIVSERALVDLYNDAIASKKPVKPDSTIIKSTLYHAMRFNGVTSDVAKKRADNISLYKKTDSPLCPSSAACVSNSKSGLGVEVNWNTNSSVSWEQVFNQFSHEANHLSVDFVDNSQSEESFGLLGTVSNTYERRGFASTANYTGLTEKILNLPDNSGILEEFSAEVGREKYLNHLISKGLKGVTGLTGYPELGIGVIDYDNPEDVGGAQSWKKFLGDGISYGELKRLHREAKRYEFYRKFGEAITKRNPYGSRLTGENVAALGAVAFHDFALYDKTHHEMLFHLTGQQITEALVLEIANKLSSIK